MENFIELCVSVSLTFLFSPIVSIIVKYAGDSIILVPPDNITEIEWLKVIEKPGGGKYVGAIERLVFLSVYWLKEYTIVTAYLAFKVAVKWETWKNIVQVPTSLSNGKKQKKGDQPLSYLSARNAWGTRVMVRFIVGTFSNYIAALMAAYFGQHFCELLKFINCIYGT